MAITPLQQRELQPAPLQTATVASVVTVAKPGQEVQANAQRREMSSSADLGAVVSLDTTSVNNNIVARTGIVPEVSGALLGLEASNPQQNTTHITTAVLSEAGRLIDQLLNLAQEEKFPASVQGKTPVLASPPAPTDTPQMAEALKNALDQSGLFYESHIGEWVDNERSLTKLMQEPQAQLHKPSQTADTANTPTPSTVADNLNYNLAQIVSQQLGVLEQNRLSWQGEIWPGQKMTWEVEEDTDEAHGKGQREEGEAQPSWRSDLRFDLPNLGSVAAKLHWSGGHIQIKVEVDGESAAASLRTHGAELADALNSKGSILDALQVQVEESS